jgi:surfeit locus 1 family protein
MIKAIFSRRWILTTLIVIAGTALCIRLGIWQLDRLEQRRAFNAHVEAMWAAPSLNLPEDDTQDLTSMEYRSVQASGSFDFENQVALRNQYWKDQYGFHLLTPLLLADGSAVLVDRGWIPGEGGDDPANWEDYREPAAVSISGIIRLGQQEPDVGGVPDEQRGLLRFWNNVNLERLGEQMPYELLPVYIQLDVDETDTQPPIAYQPEIELTEGPHLGYAGQWFTFATILFLGYPFYIRRQEKLDQASNVNSIQMSQIQ